MAGLLDVNVLVALLHERHRHAAEAVRWLARQTSASILICRVAQMGALRILTQPVVMREDVISAAEFWDGWGRLMADERFAAVSEPPDLEQVWRDLTLGLPKGRPVGTYSYFAALALAGNWTLVSFDRGFEGFRDLRSETPA
ncbi:MAG: TA system VapC family ribonuclease toxin [Chthoniobacterales bacterium]